MWLLPWAERGIRAKAMFQRLKVDASVPPYNLQNLAGVNYWRVVWNVFLKDVYLSYRICIRNLNISLFWSFFRFQDELGWFHQYESWSGMGLSVLPSRLCASIWQSDWLHLFLGRTVKWTKFFWFWVDVVCFAAPTVYLWFTFLYME